MYIYTHKWVCLFRRLEKKTIDFSKNSTKTRQVLQEELQLASSVPCGPESVNRLDASAREALEILELTPWQKCHASWWVGTPWEWGKKNTQKAGERRGQLEFLGFQAFRWLVKCCKLLLWPRCHGKCGWEYDVTTSKDGVGEILSDVGGGF